MRNRRISLKRLAILICVAVPILAWAVVKPVRMVAPAFADLTCAGPVCVDARSRVPEAEALLSQGRAFVEGKLGPLRGNPTFIFCTSQSCADYFGLGARSAVTLGTLGTVIGPRAWRPYFVRHELIHHAQGQRLGVIALLFKPGWIVEGMAYGLSEDPRTPLAEPFESERKAFLSW